MWGGNEVARFARSREFASLPLDPNCFYLREAHTLSMERLELDALALNSRAGFRLQSTASFSRPVGASQLGTTGVAFLIPRWYGGDEILLLQESTVLHRKLLEEKRKSRATSLPPAILQRWPTLGLPLGWTPSQPILALQDRLPPTRLAAKPAPAAPPAKRRSRLPSPAKSSPKPAPPSLPTPSRSFLNALWSPVLDNPPANQATALCSAFAEPTARKEAQIKSAARIGYDEHEKKFKELLKVLKLDVRRNWKSESLVRLLSDLGCIR